MNGFSCSSNNFMCNLTFYGVAQLARTSKNWWPKSMQAKNKKPCKTCKRTCQMQRWFSARTQLLLNMQYLCLPENAIEGEECVCVCVRACIHFDECCLSGSFPLENICRLTLHCCVMESVSLLYLVMIDWCDDQSSIDVSHHYRFERKPRIWLTRHTKTSSMQCYFLCWNEWMKKKENYQYIQLSLQFERWT